MWGIEIDLFLVWVPKLTCFVWGSKLTLFLCANRKLLVFGVSIGTDLVFYGRNWLDSLQVTIKTNLLAELKHQAPNSVWGIELDLISGWGWNWFGGCMGGRNWLVFSEHANWLEFCVGGPNWLDFSVGDRTWLDSSVGWNWFGCVGCRKWLHFSMVNRHWVGFVSRSKITCFSRKDRN